MIKTKGVIIVLFVLLSVNIALANVILVYEFSDSCKTDQSVFLKNFSNKDTFALVKVYETKISGKKIKEFEVRYGLKPKQKRFIGCTGAKGGLGGAIRYQYKIIEQGK